MIKDYPGFVFSVSRQFGAQQVNILIVFLLLKTYKDRFTDLSTGDVTRQGQSNKWCQFRTAQLPQKIRPSAMHENYIGTQRFICINMLIITFLMFDDKV